MHADDHRTIGTKLGPWITKPLGFVHPDVIPFWEGVNKHEFRLCHCKRCGAYYWPFTVCINHADIPDFDEMEWVPVSGRGKIFSYLVVHQVHDPDFQAEVPYGVAMVELDEGPLFPGRIVDCDPYKVKIGTPVEVAYLDVPEAGHTLPFFRPSQLSGNHQAQHKQSPQKTRRISHDNA